MSGSTGNGGERYHPGRPRAHPLPIGQSRHSQGTSWPGLPNRREENRPCHIGFAGPPQDLRVLSAEGRRRLGWATGPEGTVGPKGAARAVGARGLCRIEGRRRRCWTYGTPGHCRTQTRRRAVGPSGPPGPTGENAIYACRCTSQRPVLTAESTCRKHCPKGAESCEPVACKLLGKPEP